MKCTAEFTFYSIVWVTWYRLLQFFDFFSFLVSPTLLAVSLGWKGKLTKESANTTQNTNLRNRCNRTCKKIAAAAAVTAQKESPRRKNKVILNRVVWVRSQNLPFFTDKKLIISILHVVAYG